MRRRRDTHSAPPRRARTNSVRFTLAALVAIIAAIGSFLLIRTGDEAAPPTPTGQDGSAQSHKNAKPIVLVISVDGLNPEALDDLRENGASNFNRLVREGASTFNARSAVELTITLPNHTGMLTGRRITGAAGHSVIFNNDNGKTLKSTHGAYVPGIFDVAHDQGLSTAFFAMKDKFRYLIRSWDAAHGAHDTVGADDGRDKIDVAKIGASSVIVPEVKGTLAAGSTDLVFLHLAAPDLAGHANGWLGPDYLAAVRSVDASLGSILATIDSDPAIRDRVTLLLTADHGGRRGLARHDDKTLVANYRVPFIAWGRNVAAGADLYELNANRIDPGTRRLGYVGAQPVRNIDVANTALSLLGLSPIVGAVSTEWPKLQLN